MDQFYFCLNQHQKNILEYKGLRCNIVGLSDLNSALSRGVKKIIIFNDTIPAFYSLINKYDIEIELWQEGIIPFTGIPFNLKSRLRLAVNKFIHKNFLRGYRPYFFNGIQTIRSAYPISTLEKKGVICDKIIHDPDVFSYKQNNSKVLDGSLYLATDFYSEGLMKDHVAQIKNFINLKKILPEIKFKPHPKELKLSIGILGHDNVELDTIYASSVYGTISTSMYLNHIRGSKLNFILNDHSDIVKRAFRENVELLYS